MANSYCGLVLDDDTLCEMSDGRRAAEVPRAVIRHVALGHGVAAERPVVAILIGVFLIVLGLASACNLALWYLRGGTAHGVEALAVGLIPIGGWLVHHAMRKRYFLRISTDSGERKLAFEATAEEQLARAFVETVGRTVPCRVEVALPLASPLERRSD